jgi:hypothetical protein
MRLTIEIIAALLLLICISGSSAAFAGVRGGRSADGLSCAFSAPEDASPAVRCAAIRRQCGGRFYANYCGDRMVADM